ncbi:MAG: Ig-like domain-containing protein [Propionibacteriaceae bacterium]|jgi:hypothetical protein|nr:Ig-like domain-containing protein [Propionibacteriaceae bacterium]
MSVASRSRRRRAVVGRCKAIAIGLACLVGLSGAGNFILPATALTPAPSTLTVSVAESPWGTTALARAVVMDVFGDTMPGVPVTFSVDELGWIGGSGSPGAPSVVLKTDSNGQATVTVKGRDSCLWRDVTVRATVEVNGAQVDLAGSPALVSVFQQEISCGPFEALMSVTPTGGGSQAVADGADSLTVVMRLTDFWNQPLTGSASEIQLSALGADGQPTDALTVHPTTELGGGLYSISITAVRPGDYFLSYTEGGDMLTLHPIAFAPATVAAPVVVHPLEGMYVASGSPEVRGTAAPGLSVTVRNQYQSGSVVCAATVDSAGDWECVPTAPLAEGDQAVSVTVTDSAGNVSPPARVEFTVDITPPDAPVIEHPNEQVQVAGVWVVDGSAEPGATIELTDGAGDPIPGCAVGSVVAAADGAWSCQLSQPLADGGRVMARARDAAGHWSAATVVTVRVAAGGAPLPQAGSDTSVFSLLTAALAAGGGVLVLAACKRRRDEEEFLARAARAWTVR